MRVVITHDVFTGQKYGGVSRYLVEVAKRMPADVEVTVFAGLHVSAHLKELPQVVGIRVPLWDNSSFLRRSLSAGSHHLRMWANDRLQGLLFRPDDAAVMHLSYYNGRTIDRRWNVVVTVHDMIHELFPRYFPEKDPTPVWKRNSCQRADRIIAVSENTKSDLVRLLGIDPARVEVIHHASSLVRAYASPRNPLPRPYLLHVGTRAGYKNFASLAKAYARSDRLRKDFDLVCFGGEPLNGDERSLGVIRMTGDDAMLTTLYVHARAFVCPSLYEGFGIPVVEAMSLGCPVFSSDRSSLPEVAGDAAVYFDPEDVENMAGVLERGLMDDDLLGRLRLRGVDRAQQFDWNKTARATAAVYRSLTSAGL